MAALGGTVVDGRGLLVLLLDAVVVGVVLLVPFDRSYDRSDTGSGSVVSMEPPLRPSYLRCLVFFGVGSLASVLMIGLRSPGPSRAYEWAVTNMLLSVTQDGAAVASYVSSLSPVFPLTLLAYVVAFAVAFRAPVARRLMILSNALLFLMASALIDTFVGLLTLVEHVSLGPAPLVRLVFQYAVGGALLIRLGFTTFQLPKLTPLPLLRGNDWHDDAMLVASVGAALTVTSLGATFAVSRLGADELLLTVVVLAVPSYTFGLTAGLLGLARLVTHRRVQPDDRRPPIEVIIAAFNEESVIERLLHSIDVAARRYGGPVRVILSDDGSLDDTVPLAATTMAAFVSAQGEIVVNAHLGKSAALNEGLARCRADFVVRMDADCEAHPDCFLYSVPHLLDDPYVGLVSAMNLPKEPYCTWIDRMRLFEVITLFGFVRPASDLVDGIYCVPGTYMAFRRRPALEMGGFVDGMYGEDVEFTYSMARLGYRAVLDTRIVCYEDVPRSQQQLRIQRTRWNRGGIMAYARHVPVVTGLSGPRFWFFANRQAVKRAVMPWKLTLVTYLVGGAVLEPGSHRNLARLVTVLLLRFGVAAVPTILLTVYHGKSRQLVWLPLQPVFHLLKLYYALEAVLSFNARPVALRAPSVEAPTPIDLRTTSSTV